MTEQPTLFGLAADAPTVGACCAACGKPGRWPDDHCATCTADGVRALRFDLADAHNPHTLRVRERATGRLGYGVPRIPGTPRLHTDTTEVRWADDNTTSIVPWSTLHYLPTRKDQL